jgi:hypothetical protein
MSNQAMKHAVDAAVKAGYVQSPNNIHSLPGRRWYPKQSGIDHFVLGVIHIEPPVIAPRVPQDNWPVAVYVNTWGGGIALFRRFETWASYMNFAAKYGTKSEPGRNHV